MYKSLLEIIQDTGIRRIDNNHIEVRTLGLGQDFLTLIELSDLVSAMSSLQNDLIEELSTQILRSQL